jgi:hypothetical protein
VNKRCRLQRMPDSFPPQIGSRPPAQLLIHQREELVARVDIPASPGLQKAAHILTRTVLGVHDSCVG